MRNQEMIIISLYPNYCVRLECGLAIVNPFCNQYVVAICTFMMPNNNNHA